VHLLTAPAPLPAFQPALHAVGRELRRVECIKFIHRPVLVTFSRVFPPVDPLLQMPASVSNALQQLGTSLDPAGNEALRFPLSVGERREDADHTGAPSYVVDAIFNADVVRHLAAHQPRCLVHCCLQPAVAQHHHMILTADDHMTVDLRNRVRVQLQIQVSAHVRQLKTFICNLLLEYVGSKVSASTKGLHCKPAI
jgi:PIH1 N-terminal domain